MSPWSGFKGDGADSDPSLQSDELVGDFESGYEIDARFDAFLDLPREIHDPCFTGTDLNTHHRCRHGAPPPQRKVAFDMAATGRRFLGCPRQGADRCSFVVWVDDPWNPVLTRSLMQLWSLVGLRSREGIPTCEPETQMDQAYISLLTEKNNLLIAVDQLEHSFATRELKLKDLIRRNNTEAAWRPISSPPRPVAEMQPVHVDGKLYWMVDPNLVETNTSLHGCEMLALDVGTEDFEVLQGPRCSYDQITSIVELDGNVCVVCSDKGAKALDIWMLEAGGVWAIGRRVELGEFSHEYSPEETAPMAVDPTDGRLLLSTGRALGYYSPKTRKIETIHRLVDQDAMKFAPLLSEESLISPYIRFEKATYSVSI